MKAERSPPRTARSVLEQQHDLIAAHDGRDHKANSTARTCLPRLPKAPQRIGGSVVTRGSRRSARHATTDVRQGVGAFPC